MSKPRKSSASTVRVYSDGKLVQQTKVRGGPAPGYVGRSKASSAAKAARRKAG